ncbi:MAG: hypothetical protein ACLQU2_18700 [Candidatus Binataceae bacterium]
MLSVKTAPNSVSLGTTTVVTFTTVIYDPTGLVSQVILQRAQPPGAGLVGELKGSRIDYTLWTYSEAVRLREPRTGTIQFSIVVQYELPSHVTTMTVRRPQTLAPQPVNVEVTGPTVAVSPTAQPIIREGEGVRVVVPPGWQSDDALSAMGGPLNLNTFNSQYERGGVIPPGQASIDIARVKLPPAVEHYVSNELEGSEVRSSNAVTVAGSIGRIVFYVDSFAPGLTYDNATVYVPRGSVLYKFFLTYNSNDPRGPSFQSDFRSVLNSVQFRP